MIYRWVDETIWFGLVEEEMVKCADVGVRKFLQSYHNNARDRHGANSEKNGFQISIRGATGEVVVATLNGTPYDPQFGQYRKPDVHPDIDAKTSGCWDPHLTTHKNSPDKWRFISVGAMSINTFRINGWLYGYETKIHNPVKGRGSYWGDRWNNGRPAFNVPPDQLRSIRTFMTADALTVKERWNKRDTTDRRNFKCDMAEILGK